MADRMNGEDLMESIGVETKRNKKTIGWNVCVVIDRLIGLYSDRVYIVFLTCHHSPSQVYC